MKCVIHNNTNATIVLPSCFSGFPIPANGAKDFTYNSIPGQDRLTLMTLATTTPASPQNPLFPNSSIDFPGYAGLGISAGLPVSGSVTYVINGQEPADVAPGTSVTSLTDNETRRYTTAELWVTDGRDKWLPTGNTAATRHLGMTFSLPNGDVLAVGGSNATTEIYKPNTGKWTAGPTVPVSILKEFTGGVLSNGWVLICGTRTNLLPARDQPKTYSFLLNPANLSGGWIATKPLPVGMASLKSHMRLVLLPSGKMLLAGGSDSASWGVDETTGNTDNGALDNNPSSTAVKSSNYSLLFTFDSGTPSNSSWDVTRDIGGSTVATVSGSGGAIAKLDVGGGVESAHTIKFVKSGAGFTSAHKDQPFVISGAANAANNGTWMIHRYVSANEVWYTNASAVNEPSFGGSFSAGNAKPATYLPFRTSITVPTLMDDGRVLVVGGVPGLFAPFASNDAAAAFSPSTGIWAVLAVMPDVPSDAASDAGARTSPGIIKLPSGKILVLGGTKDTFFGLGRTSAIILDPSDDSWSIVQSAMTHGRPDAALTTTMVGSFAYVVGNGYTNSTGERTSEYFDPANQVFFLGARKPQTPSVDNMIATLPGGRLLLLGGSVGNGVVTLIPSKNVLIFSAGIPADDAPLGAISDGEPPTTISGYLNA